MDAMTDPSIDRVTFMKSRRVGYTKILTALTGYHIAHDACSILHVQPTVKDAEDYSRDEFDPMLRDVPSVGSAFGDVKSRDKRNRLQRKSYPGGTMYLVGANSGTGFRRISVRIVQFDEVDGYPLRGAGNEGNVIDLGIGRTEDAWNRLILIGSTPLFKGLSIVEASYLESDQRRYFVPCPHCDHGQRFRWGGKDLDYGIKWPHGEPENAAYLCEHCHALIEHREKFRMIDAGEWIPGRTSEDGKWEPDPSRRCDGHAGFHIWAAYSYLPNTTWGTIAQQWAKVGRDPLRLQVFVNQVQGETFEFKGKSPNEDQLANRREAYPTRMRESETAGAEPEVETLVPHGAAVLTSFTDVQFNRLETMVVGWGLGEEAWALEYHVSYGDPTAEPVWQALSEYLSRPRPLERGGVDFIRSSGIDAGYASNSVHAFAAARPVYRTGDGRLSYTWATKGTTGKGPVWPPKAYNSKLNTPVWPVNVDTAKDYVTARLGIQEPGPGYWHFPTSFGDDFFRQLSAEQSRELRDKRGFPVRVWELKPGRERNEGFDCVVGNYAVLCALQSIGLDLEDECKRAASVPGWSESVSTPKPRTTQPPEAIDRERAKVRGSNWVRDGVSRLR